MAGLRLAPVITPGYNPGMSTSFDAAAIVHQLKTEYAASVGRLREALKQFLAGGAPPSAEDRITGAFAYPELRIHWAPGQPFPRISRAYARVGAPGTYAVTETVPVGWQQTGATCSNGSQPSAIVLGAGQLVTCTYTNTNLAPTIVVTKTAIPTSVPEPGGNVTFTFTVQNTSSEEPVTITVLTVSFSICRPLNFGSAIEGSWWKKTVIS